MAVNSYVFLSCMMIIMYGDMLRWTWSLTWKIFNSNDLRDWITPAISQLFPYLYVTPRFFGSLCSYNCETWLETNINKCNLLLQNTCFSFLNDSFLYLGLFLEENGSGNQVRLNSFRFFVRICFKHSPRGAGRFIIKNKTKKNLISKYFFDCLIWESSWLPSFF